jgi:SAM-dependent methyltransferase
MSDSDGWTESAAAWIAEMGDGGDFSRRSILDRPMLARVERGRFTSALDIGCGEGRFCRELAARGIKTIGIDPTASLLAEARRRDPNGDYRLGRAEALQFPGASFDLVVSYLTLIDIPDIRRAIPEMARVLRPGGSLLIANLNSFITAAPPEGWTRCPDGTRRFCIDNYLLERAEWISWSGVRILNWHRPLSTYMALLLGERLVLRHFEEPVPTEGDPERVARYRRVPFFLVMEWQKPLPEAAGPG